MEEKLYPPHGDWKQSIDMAENIDPYALEVCTHKFLDLLPNTYVYTKSLAEHVVNDYCHGHIPTLIIRPSIGNWDEKSSYSLNIKSKLIFSDQHFKWSFSWMDR